MLPPVSLPPANSFWEQERIHLIAVCTRLTGNPMAAEDLAQETLYEAWRHRERLHDATGVSAWLAAIARHVCLRWQAHEYRAPAYQSVDDLGDTLDTLVDPLDLAAIVEQAEARQLLEHVLTLLPTSTRSAICDHYIFDVPFSAIAVRQGLAEATVKMQVHRGKLRLRHLLATTFAAEAMACGLIERSGGEWLPTSLWCPQCGQRHLDGQWDFAVGTLRLQCRDCSTTTGVYSAYEAVPELFHGITSLKAGFNRVMRWVNAFYVPALEQGGVTCECGRFLPLVRHLPEEMPAIYRGISPEHYRHIRGMHLHCPACNGTGTMRLTNLALYLPTAWRFWSAHGRIRTLPEQEIQFQQHPALLLSFQSVESRAQLDIIVAPDTYAILNIQ